MEYVSEGMSGTDLSVYGDDEKKESSGGFGENGGAVMDDTMLKQEQHADQGQDVVVKHRYYITADLKRYVRRPIRRATGSNGEAIERFAPMFSVLLTISTKFLHAMDEITTKRKVILNVDIRMFGETIQLFGGMNLMSRSDRS